MTGVSPHLNHLARCALMSSRKTLLVQRSCSSEKLLLQVYRERGVSLVLVPRRPKLLIVVEDHSLIDVALLRASLIGEQ